MFRIDNADIPPDKLLDYLNSDLSLATFLVRQRAVLYQLPNGNWRLLCCVVEAFPDVELAPCTQTSRRYPTALLYEKWLNLEDAIQLVEKAQKGAISFDDIAISRRGGPAWHSEPVPLGNAYMNRSGYIAAVELESDQTSAADQPLLSPTKPYYPDLGEAARDWLRLTQYQGIHDARNRKIIFLLPEARAFIADAVSEKGELQVTIAGSQVQDREYIVKGAYWEQQKIFHFQAQVGNGRANLQVPDEVERLEFFLTDMDGVVYNFHRESRFGHTGLDRRRLINADRTLAERIETARRAGEGSAVEFKSFVNVKEGMGTRDKKTKLRELVTAVVAFANTNGGVVCIGIDDECRACGIDDGIRRAMQTDVSSESLERYRGALTSAVKDSISGHVDLQVSYADFEGVHVVLLSVGQANVYVNLRDDSRLYVRAGSSNRQMSPREWSDMRPGRIMRELAPTQIEE